MTIKQASEESGFAVGTLYRKITAGNFLACKPRGCKGGWEINPASFRQWVQSNREAAVNRR